MTIRYGDRTEIGNPVTNWGRGALAGGIGATGGTVATPGDGFKYHTFNSPGTFTVTGGSGDVGVILVAGGGGGGDAAPTNDYQGGGGGAGGLRTMPMPVSPSPGTYPITVGAGGARNTSGNPTSAFGITVDGGGRGGIGQSPGSGPGSNGQPGGSAGGNAGSGPYGSASRTQPLTAQFGSNGGSAQSSQGGGGGGGGAAANGANGTIPQGGNGGAGVTLWGTAYAGGGGGAKGTGGTGGTGGGGNGGTPTTPGGNGTNGLGGGGGGGLQPVPTRLAGAGGDGAVVIRYWVGT